MPFVIPRIFRPTFLEYFQIDNYDLGVLFSTYGFVAMVSYFFGGFVADRFPPRILMALGLALTGLSGLTVPFVGGSFLSLLFLYGFWGLTTIFIFWAALIKSTRVWGGEDKQSYAFAMLDGGRGLSVAVIGSFITLAMTSTASQKINAESIRPIVLAFALSTLVIAVLVFLAMPKEKASDQEKLRSQRLPLQDLMDLLRHREIWLLSVIVVCAYVGYKSTDIFPLYGSDVYSLDGTKSAYVGLYTLWLRPLIALGIAFVGRTWKVDKLVFLSFIITTAGSLWLALYNPVDGALFTLIIHMAFMCTGIYAIRAVYFALLGETSVPLHLTGTAVGLISFVGYTPDVFFGPTSGLILDGSPGLKGHQNLYLLVAFFSLLGTLAAYLFAQRSRN